MKDFDLKIFNGNIETELEEIGFDKGYIFEAANKFKYKNFKVFSLTPAQANIIKQTALSVGADCATHKEVITGKAEFSNCIIGGSYSQIKKISAKLKHQPFGLKDLAEQLEKSLETKFNPLYIGENIFDFSRTYIVGILNLGNSFSDGYSEYEGAIEHLNDLIGDGADVIDIGAESTRPNSQMVEDEEQLKKILPILDYITKENIKIPISVDTRTSKVAQACLEHGANMINDVSGLDFDNNMVSVVSEFNCPVIIQHSSATPEVMQEYTNYENLMDDIYKSLKKKIDYAIANGVKQDNIIIDAGICFGKTRTQNCEILKRFDELYSLNRPIMLGISRKSFLNIPNANNYTKDIYTLALNSVLINKNVNFIRVHNVKLHKQLFDCKIL